MAGIARVRDPVSFCHGGRDELERMGVHISIRDGALDLWHVTRHTVAPKASEHVMGVLLDSTRRRAIRRPGAVAFETHRAGWLQQLGFVVRARRHGN